MIPILGDALFIAAFAGFCVFFFSYLIFSDWKSSPVGQNLLAFMGVCGLVLASRFLRLVLGDPLWDRVRDHVSVVDYLLVNIVVWWRVVLLLKTQRASRHEVETGRATAEISRKTAERVRVAAEEIRVTAEGGRVIAEIDREAAELERRREEEDLHG